MDDWTCMKRAYAVKHAGRGGTSLDAVITIGHPRPSQFGPTVHIRQTGCRNLVNDGARSATWIAEHHFDAAGMHGLDDSLGTGARSEEHTSELQSLMRNSYAVFCLKQKK